MPCAAVTVTVVPLITVVADVAVVYSDQPFTFQSLIALAVGAVKV